MCRDVAEQSQDLAHRPSFPSLPSLRQPALSDLGGIRQPPLEEVHPAQRPDAASPPSPPPVLLGEATGGIPPQADPLGAAAGPEARRAHPPGTVVVGTTAEL